METSDTYMGYDKVLIHVIEHEMDLALDILFQHTLIGKCSDIINV